MFIALTVDSHRRFGELTNAELLTPDVVAGKRVWHRKNCINCHTLLGEGAYYGPDLTRIAALRADVYLREFLRDPLRFYSEERDRRIMPNPNLSDEEIDHLIAFLDWISKIDNQGWPPRPILVTGASIPGTAVGAAYAPAASDDPVALGSTLFQDPATACFSCHSTAPGVSMVGPTMAGLAARAAEIVQRPDYTGSATTPEGYIREAILEPSAYIVPGPNYGARGVSLMPADYDERLTDDQVEALVAYLMTLR